jgi:hypothetical protein
MPRAGEIVEKFDLYSKEAILTVIVFAGRKPRFKNSARYG